MSCEELFDKQCLLIQQIVETHYNFHLNRLSKIFFIRQPEIIYDRRISSFTISLSYLRMHPLSSSFPFFNMFLGQ